MLLGGCVVPRKRRGTYQIHQGQLSAGNKSYRCQHETSAYMIHRCKQILSRSVIISYHVIARYHKQSAFSGMRLVHIANPLTLLQSAG